MNFIKALAVGSFLVFFFSACFELREEVNVKNDGQGDLKLVVNLSESKDNVREYLGMGEAEGLEVPKEENIEKILNHVRVVAMGVEGLSHVNIKSDYEDFVFILSAQFENIEAVNKAVSEVSKQLSYLYVPALESKNFSFSGDGFTRHFDYPIHPDEYRSLPSIQRYMFETARAVSIYRFGKSIREYSNKKAMLSPSGKAIKLETTLAELASGSATLENRISF